MGETIKDLGAEEFMELIEAAEMGTMIKETNMTLFVPSDEAIEDFR